MERVYIPIGIKSRGRQAEFEQCEPRLTQQRRSPNNAERNPGQAAAAFKRDNDLVRKEIEREKKKRPKGKVPNL